MRLQSLCLMFSLFLAAAILAEESAEQPPAKPAELTSPAKRETFLLVPLRVYRLRAEKLPAADCRLEDRDIERILTKVNRVWAVAGITFGLDSIREEQADIASFEKLHRLQSLLEEQASPAKTEESAESEANAALLAQRNSRFFKALIPQHTREFNGFRVYYVQEFDVNGIYYGHREAMVKATARLSPVPGGIDEPLPRVTSHELGHGLGLPHRQNKINLMASGTTGTSFIASEIEIARKIALETPGVILYTEIAEQLKRSTEPAETTRLKAWQTAVELQTP